MSAQHDTHHVQAHHSAEHHTQQHHEQTHKPIVCHITNASGEVVHSTDGGFIAPLLAGLAGLFLPKLIGLGSGEQVPYKIHIGHLGKNGVHLGEGHSIPSGHKLSVPAMKKYVHQHLMKGEGVFASGVKYHDAIAKTPKLPRKNGAVHAAGVFGSVSPTTCSTAKAPHLQGKHYTLNKAHVGKGELVPHDHNNNSLINDEIHKKKIIGTSITGSNLHLPLAKKPNTPDQYFPKPLY